jgi:ABC-2 type transport system ATP-binding protein
VIETVGLGKRFGETAALVDLDLRVEAGEVMGFLGPNGSGKTTTIRLLMGLLRPSTGHAAILGRDCHRDAVALKREVGYLPDEPFLYPYLTGLETLELVGGLHGFSATEVRRRAGAIVERLGLGPAAGGYTVTYSLGMKKRLALALALIHEPRVLILDEPTNGLDPAGARQMRAAIAEYAASGRTIFLSTHLLDAAERLCHRVAIIRAGRLLAVGTPDDLHARFSSVPGTTLEELFLRLTGPIAEPGASPAGAGSGSARAGVGSGSSGET